MRFRVTDYIISPNIFITVTMLNNSPGPPLIPFIIFFLEILDAGNNLKENAISYINIST